MDLIKLKIRINENSSKEDVKKLEAISFLISEINFIPNKIRSISNQKNIVKILNLEKLLYNYYFKIYELLLNNDYFNVLIGELFVLNDSRLLKKQNYVAIS